MGARRGPWALAIGALVAILPARWAAADVPLPEVQPDPPSVVRAERLLWEPGSDFYYAIGRDDLAERVRLRQSLKITSRVLGAAALIGGGAWWFVEQIPYAFCGQSGGLYSYPCPPSKVHWGPDLLMVGGLTALLVPSWFDNDPLSSRERDALLRDFVARKRAMRLSIAPHFDRDGASLALWARF